MKHRPLLLALAVAGTSLFAGEVRTLKLEAPAGLTRADLRYEGDPKKAEGVLLICPGNNGDGAALFSDGWRRLAQRHRLLLAGIAFSSREEDVATDGPLAYYRTENGSGKALNDGLRRLTGRDLPLVIFGYSNGAKFANRYVYQNPRRIRVWASYAIGWVAEPSPDAKVPPGVVACGLLDTNVSTARDTFLAARRAKGPVCWLGVPGKDHGLDAAALVWIRTYFDEELSRRPDAPEVWREASDRGLDGFLVKCRFPSESCANEWASFGRTPPR